MSLSLLGKFGGCESKEITALSELVRERALAARIYTHPQPFLLGANVTLEYSGDDLVLNRLWVLTDNTTGCFSVSQQVPNLDIVILNVLVAKAGLLSYDTRKDPKYSENSGVPLLAKKNFDFGVIALRVHLIQLNLLVSVFNQYQQPLENATLQIRVYSVDQQVSQNLTGVTQKNGDFLIKQLPLTHRDQFVVEIQVAYKLFPTLFFVKSFAATTDSVSENYTLVVTQLQMRGVVSGQVLNRLGKPITYGVATLTSTVAPENVQLTFQTNIDAAGNFKFVFDAFAGQTHQAVVGIRAPGYVALQSNPIVLEQYKNAFQSFDNKFTLSSEGC